jgi:ABC-type branched-subunit amino acid transport system ATPase component
MLEIKEITQVFGGLTALNNVSIILKKVKL